MTSLNACRSLIVQTCGGLSSEREPVEACLFKGCAVINDRTTIVSSLAAISIGFMPVWMVLLPLDITSDPENWQIFVRGNFLAVTLVEMLFVLAAMLGVFSPFNAIKQLPTLSKIAILIWISVTCLVSFQPGKDDLATFIGLLRLLSAALFFLALISLKNSLGPSFMISLWQAIGLGFLLYVGLWSFHIYINAPQGDDWVTRIPGVNNVRHTGHFAFAGICAGLFGLISLQGGRHVWSKWALVVSFGSTGLGLALWTGSRGPFLASLTAVLVTFCVAAEHRKKIAGFFVLSALAATAVVSLLPVPHQIYGIYGATGAADIAEIDQADGSSGRTELWSGTMDKILERPIFGWGLNQFDASGPSKPAHFFHPHNSPLQIMFSGGIVSILLVVFMIFPALRRWSWPYTGGSSAAGVGAVVGILVYSLYDGALYFGYPIMIFLVAVVSSIAPITTHPPPCKSDQIIT